jgi:hypothetical protein
LATVDVPFRFSNSKAVGAALGLTPRRQQSGEIDRMGGISKCGPLMRETLFEVALVLMTHRGKWSWLQGLGHEDCAAPWQRAIVAVARRLAVIMHRMWVDGTGASRDQERSYKIRSRWSTAWERLPMGHDLYWLGRGGLASGVNTSGF